MTYSCTDLKKGCMVDLKGDNEMVVSNSDKISLDVTEVGTQLLRDDKAFVVDLQYLLWETRKGWK